MIRKLRKWWHRRKAAHHADLEFDARLDARVAAVNGGWQQVQEAAARCHYHEARQREHLEKLEQL